jgi:hypothetical protein
MGFPEQKLINEKWHLENKKSTRLIVLPVTGWGIAYILLFVFFPIKIFLFSLTALIPLVLGYFGIFFVLSKELTGESTTGGGDQQPPEGPSSRCFKCGRKLASERAVQCNSCGFSWYQCPSCGSEWQRGTVLCSACGKHLRELTPKRVKGRS